MNRLNPLWAVAALAPLMLWGVCVVMPVYDDYWYFTTPGRGIDFSVGSLLPNDQYWRPFDALFGLLLATWPGAFPVLNHVAVFAAHVGCTLLVWGMVRGLGLPRMAVAVATLIFYLSPAAAGTLLNSDSLNQAYSALFGLLSLRAYMGGRATGSRILWAALVLVAALWKENGLAWAAIGPLFAWGMAGARGRSLWRGAALCALVCAAYFGARLSLQVGSMVGSDYMEHRQGSLPKYIATWMSYSLLPLDYISLMFGPARNWASVTLTAAASSPFLLTLASGLRRAVADRRFLCAAACAVVAALPHLATMFGNMHCYASLPMVALAAAILATHCRGRRLVAATFALYMAACAFSSFRHWQAARRSGEVGKAMATEILRQSHGKPQRVLLLYDEETEAGFSTFCTTPMQSFGYGEAVRMLTRYEWPRDITGEPIPPGSNADAIVKGAIGNGFDAVWRARGDSAWVAAER